MVDMKGSLSCLDIFPLLQESDDVTTLISGMAKPLDLPAAVAASSNKSLHWIFTPLRYVKTSEFNRWADIVTLAVINGLRYYIIHDQIIQM